MYNQMLVAILVFQISYIGILSIKKFPYSVLLIIPLIVTICWALMVYRKFAEPLNFLAVHAAADLDRADLVRTPSATPTHVPNACCAVCYAMLPRAHPVMSIVCLLVSVAAAEGCCCQSVRMIWLLVLQCGG